jgi:hypothetical protein
MSILVTVVLVLSAVVIGLATANLVLLDRYLDLTRHAFGDPEGNWAARAQSVMDTADTLATVNSVAFFALLLTVAAGLRYTAVLLILSGEPDAPGRRTVIVTWWVGVAGTFTMDLLAVGLEAPGPNGSLAEYADYVHALMWISGGTLGVSVLWIGIAVWLTWMSLTATATTVDGYERPG